MDRGLLKGFFRSYDSCIPLTVQSDSLKIIETSECYVFEKYVKRCTLLFNILSYTHEFIACFTA